MDTSGDKATVLSSLCGTAGFRPQPPEAQTTRAAVSALTTAAQNCAALHFNELTARRCHPPPIARRRVVVRRSGRATTMAPIMPQGHHGQAGGVTAPVGFLPLPISRPAIKVTLMAG